MSQDISNPRSIRPEIYILWDGEPLEALGVGMYLESATIGSTTRRTSTTKSTSSKPDARSSITGRTVRQNRARKYVRRAPKVSGAQLKFIVPDQVVATTFMRLFEINSRPKITVGFRTPGVLGENKTGTGARVGGALVGTYKIDNASWQYPAAGFITLTLNGKADKYLGLASYKAPRYFEEKTVRHIIESIAKEHDLDVDLGGVPAETLDATVTAAKVNQESDYNFLDRLADIVGISGMTLGPQESSDLRVVKVDPKDTLVVTGSVQGPDIGTASRNAYTRRRAKEGVKQYARNVLKFSKMPSFLGRTRGVRKEPKVVLAYGPGIAGQEVTSKGALILKVSSLQVRVPRMGANLANSGRVSGKKSIGSLYMNVMDLKGNVSRVSLTGSTLPASESAVEPNIATVSNTRQKRKIQTPTSKGDKALPGGAKYEVQYMSGAPPSVSNDLSLATRVSSRTREMGFHSEIDVTLDPGFPFLNSPGEVHLVGTYIHDGYYGVEEATHSYSASSGLATRLKLLRVSRRRRSNDGTTGGSRGSSDLYMTVKDPYGGGSQRVNLTTGKVDNKVANRVHPDVSGAANP